MAWLDFMFGSFTRMRRPELMDDISVNEFEIERALKALTRMHRLSLTAHFISKAILSLVGSRQTTLRILDLGSGRGDVLCSVVEHLQARGLKVEATGVDMNPHSVALANAYAHKRGSPARFVSATALEALSSTHYDLVTSSLFLHHLDEPELVALFSEIRRCAAIGMVMSDLERSRLSYVLTWLVTRLISRSHMVQHDGLVSVRGALDKGEFTAITERAGMESCQITRTFPFRVILTWKNGLDAVDDHN